MAWTYSGDPQQSWRDAVRFTIQDTDESSPLVQDEEIAWAISQESTATDTTVSLSDHDLYGACARVMEALANRFSMQADQTIGSAMEVVYSKMAAQYTDRAKNYRQRSINSGGAPSAPGLDRGFRQAQRQDSSLSQPMFDRRQFDAPRALDDTAGPLSGEFG